MPQRKLAVIILAAGKGTRMRSSRPKVLHEIAGRPILGHVGVIAAALKPQRLLIVAPAKDQSLAQAVPGAKIVVQDPPRGTGDAVRCACETLNDFKGDILILCGDAPLITQATLSRLLSMLRIKKRNATISLPELAVLGFRLDPPHTYGRLIVDTQGYVSDIVETSDATPAQKRLTLCSSGVFAVRASELFGVLNGLSNQNAQGEFYLPDVVRLITKRGGKAVFIEGKADELAGINTQAELAEAERIMQNRLRTAAMRRGVTLIDPETVWFNYDTKVAAGVIIHPNVVFGPKVSIGSEVRIESFCHISGTQIAARAVIGPFARLRPNTVIRSEARIGNFVELKNTKLETRAKINHLSYVGDARVGSSANIGAGVITCNYDGIQKHQTTIGKGAFVGSNASLIAPVHLGAGAVIGAGSVITGDIDSNALALTRPPLTQKAGWKNRRSKRSPHHKMKRDRQKTVSSGKKPSRNLAD